MKINNNLIININKNKIIRSFYKNINRNIIKYKVILKNFSKVNFLRNIKNIILIISSNFYSKIKIIYIEIKYLKLIFKVFLKIINIKYKFIDNKKIFNINNNNIIFLDVKLI